MKPSRGIAFCVAVAIKIIISTVTVSTASADTTPATSSSSSPNDEYEGFSSRFGRGDNEGIDHEDYTNPNIYDGKRNSENT